MQKQSAPPPRCREPPSPRRVARELTSDWTLVHQPPDGQGRPRSPRDGLGGWAGHSALTPAAGPNPAPRHCLHLQDAGRLTSLPLPPDPPGAVPFHCSPPRPPPHRRRGARSREGGFQEPGAPRAVPRSRPPPPPPGVTWPLPDARPTEAPRGPTDQQRRGREANTAALEQPEKDAPRRAPPGARAEPDSRGK